MRLTCYFTAFLALFGIVRAEAQSKIWTLEECMQYAIEHSPQTQIQILTNENYRQNYIEAIANLTPSVSASAGGTFSFGRSLNPADNTYYNTTNFKRRNIMKNVFRNFLRSIRTNYAATILNLVGLTAAFTAFIVIMMQVRYDLTFDRFDKNSGRIYIPTMKGLDEEDDIWLQTNRVFGELIVHDTPGVEAGGMINGPWENYFYPDAQDKNTFYRYPSGRMSTGLLDVFDFETVAGDLHRIAIPNTLIVSNSIAQEIYQGDAVGHKLFMAGNDSIPYEIVGVYKDFPKNSSLKNGIFTNIGNTRLTDVSNNSDIYYLLVNPNISTEELVQNITQTIDNAGYANSRHTEDAEWIVAPLIDLYFNKMLDGREKGNKTTTYMLLTVAIVKVLSGYPQKAGCCTGH